MDAFSLDARLAADTIAIAELPLSAIRLMRDRRFPWLVLAPRRPGLVELTDLPRDERATLMEEIVQAGKALRAAATVEKLNVGALGNIVRQLHVHVVGRRIGDAAWPGPVWGAGAAEPYPPGEAETLAARIAAALG
jgi:diadenosine tetraphosphate (Ap4A) HIT family hydrolase